MSGDDTLGSHFVESGRYGSARDVVEDGLRLLEDREKRFATRLGELLGQVEAGRDSGASERDGEAFLDELEARYQAMAARRA